MPQEPTATQEQIDYLLSVDRLLSAAEEARRNRDRLLERVREADRATTRPADKMQRGPSR
jgi:hypothetical protein